MVAAARVGGRGATGGGGDEPGVTGVGRGGRGSGGTGGGQVKGRPDKRRERAGKSVGAGTLEET